MWKKWFESGEGEKKEKKINKQMNTSLETMCQCFFLSMMYIQFERAWITDEFQHLWFIVLVQEHGGCDSDNQWFLRLDRILQDLQNLLCAPLFRCLIVRLDTKEIDCQQSHGLFHMVMTVTLTLTKTKIGIMTVDIVCCLVCLVGVSMTLFFVFMKWRKEKKLQKIHFSFFLLQNKRYNHNK